MRRFPRQLCAYCSSTSYDECDIVSYKSPRATYRCCVVCCWRITHMQKRIRAILSPANYPMYPSMLPIVLQLHIVDQRHCAYGLFLYAQTRLAQLPRDMYTAIIFPMIHCSAHHAYGVYTHAAAPSTLIVTRYIMCEDHMHDAHVIIFNGRAAFFA